MILISSQITIAQLTFTFFQLALRLRLVLRLQLLISQQRLTQMYHRRHFSLERYLLFQIHQSIHLPLLFCERFFLDLRQIGFNILPVAHQWGRTLIGHRYIRPKRCHLELGIPDNILWIITQVVISVVSVHSSHGLVIFVVVLLTII